MTQQETDLIAWNTLENWPFGKKFAVYVAPEDSRLMVKRHEGNGRSFNLGHRGAFLILTAFGVPVTLIVVLLHLLFLGSALWTEVLALAMTAFGFWIIFALGLYWAAVRMRKRIYLLKKKKQGVIE